MLNAERQPQITLFTRLFAWTRAESTPRRTRTSWLQAFQVGLADLGDARVMPGVMGSESSRKPESRNW